MTEQQPSRELAIVPATPTREVATADTDSWVEVMRPILALAEKVYDTEFVPRGLRGNAAATAAAMLYGREVHLPPMTALNVTHVIEGKPGISAEAMRAMILAAGHELEFLETTGAICTMRARRRTQERWTELSWTIDAARAAGVTGKDNWKKYPRAMLIARCTTDLARMIFPDVIHGFRSVEELDDLEETAPGEAGGAEQPTGTTKVTRKRVAKKTAAKALPAPAPAAADGPPLPGEPGYEDSPAGDAPAADHDDAPAAVEPGSRRPGTKPEGGESGGATRGAAGEADTPPSSDSPGSDDDADTVGASESPAVADPGDREKANPRPISRGQHRALMAQWSEIGIVDDREERLLATSTIVGREVESTNNLTHGEAAALIDTLARLEGSREKLNGLLDTIDQAKAEEAQAEAGDQ